MKKTKKYRCLGGWVTSLADHDRHYIPASRLPGLYGVDPQECIFININDDVFEKQRGYDLSTLIDLWPDSTGKYILPLR